MEIELKVAVQAERLPALRSALHDLGAKPHAPVLQDDVFFQHPCRDLVALDEAFRLRRVGGEAVLTWKGPRLEGDLKARPEHNVRVADDPLALLEALGFVAAARLRKTREAWHLPDVEVAIDSIAGVGDFVEIEAHDAVGGAEAVEAMARTLGLDGLEPVHVSYLELALEAGADAAALL